MQVDRILILYTHMISVVLMFNLLYGKPSFGLES
mgnify:CR=1 FL=1